MLALKVRKLEDQNKKKDDKIKALSYQLEKKNYKK